MTSASVKFGFDRQFRFNWPQAYKSPTYKGLQWTLLWLWFSIRIEASWKKLDTY